LKFAIDGLLLTAIVWTARSVLDFHQFRQGIPSSLLVAAGAALLLGWAYRFDRSTAGAIALAPLRWCGERCYSLYLVHAPISLIGAWCLFHAGVTSATATLLVTVPVCAGSSAFAGWLFHRYIERYFLNGPATTKERL